MTVHQFFCILHLIDMWYIETKSSNSFNRNTLAICRGERQFKTIRDMFHFGSKRKHNWMSYTDNTAMRRGSVLRLNLFRSFVWGIVHVQCIECTEWVVQKCFDKYSFGNFYSTAVRLSSIYMYPFTKRRLRVKLCHRIYGCFYIV